MPPRKTIFLDRDGVINVEANYVHRIEDFCFLPGAIAGLRSLQALDYVLVIVTNQAGIARGYYTEADFLTLMNYVSAHLADNGVSILHTYYCPHHPSGSVMEFSISCSCRKPEPGMILRAAAELDLSLSQSIVVGDKLSDIEAGRAANVWKTVLVRSGHPLPEHAEKLADHCCDDLAAAVDWIKRLEKAKGNE